MEYARGSRCGSNSYEVSSKKKAKDAEMRDTRVKRGSEKIFEFLLKQEKRAEGREEPLIPKGKSYVATNLLLTKERKMCKECNYVAISAAVPFSSPFSTLFYRVK